MRRPFSWICSVVGQVSFLALSLPRVINTKFPLQPHQLYNITQYGDCLAIHSLLRWKMTNSHYLTYTLLLRVMGECTFWAWECSKFRQTSIKKNGHWCAVTSGAPGFRWLRSRTVATYSYLVLSVAASLKLLMLWIDLHFSRRRFTSVLSSLPVLHISLNRVIANVYNCAFRFYGTLSLHRVGIKKVLLPKSEE